MVKSKSWSAVDEWNRAPKSRRVELLRILHLKARVAEQSWDEMKVSTRHRLAESRELVRVLRIQPEDVVVEASENDERPRRVLKRVVRRSDGSGGTTVQEKASPDEIETGMRPAPGTAGWDELHIGTRTSMCQAAGIGNPATVAGLSWSSVPSHVRQVIADAFPTAVPRPKRESLVEGYSSPNTSVMGGMWNAMDVSLRVGLCKQAGLPGRSGSADWGGLTPESQAAIGKIMGTAAVAVRNYAPVVYVVTAEFVFANKNEAMSFMEASKRLFAPEVAESMKVTELLR